MDSRDRRRRELEPPRPEEPPEKLEPSTSWWPVSSAERKRNVTLVRATRLRHGHSEVGELGIHGVSLARRVVLRRQGQLKGDSTREAAPDTSDPATPGVHSRASSVAKQRPCSFV